MTRCCMNQTTVGRTLTMRTTQQSIILVGILTTLWHASALARAEFPGKHPFPGVTYKQETRKEPPMQLYIAEVNLAKLKVKVHVSPGGPDPDGPGEWQTTLLEPTKVAARDNFDLVVNGGFFRCRRDNTAQGSQPHSRTNRAASAVGRAVSDGTAAGSRRPRSPHLADTWASAVGPAVSDGKVWSATNEPVPCLVVRKNGRPSIEMLGEPPPDAVEVIAGSTLLAEKGKPITHENNPDRFPRTVVGLNRKGTRLVILVVDGRKPGVSIGMTFAELARKLVRLGCYTAINLDGGGSSVMAMRDPADGKYCILNTPSDGHERAVASVLGITVEYEKKK